jgi:hypothetical protein
MNKRYISILVMVLAILAAGLFFAGRASAQTNQPFQIIFTKEGYSEAGPDAMWTVPEWGLLCIEDGSETRCYCKCGNGICEVTEQGQNPASTTIPATSVPTVTPNTPAPTATPILTEPTATPAPTDTPEPAQHCNQGVGNGPEGCSPGNSDHNQPPNDEGQPECGYPGHPCRQK